MRMEGIRKWPFGTRDENMVNPLMVGVMVVVEKEVVAANME